MCLCLTNNDKIKLVNVNILQTNYDCVKIISQWALCLINFDWGALLGENNL